MHPDWTDYPFSLLRDAAGHFIVRMVLLAGVIALGMLAGAGVCALRHHGFPWHQILALAPVLMISGLAQGWGIIAYLGLAVFAVVYAYRDLSLRWLILPFLLQAIEAYRWCASWKS